MSDSTTLGLPAAARQLGTSVRALRRAMRAGALPSPTTASGKVTATVALPASWVAETKAAIKASPKVLSSTARPKVPPFARFEGTSAFRKYPNKVREFNLFRAQA